MQGPVGDRAAALVTIIGGETLLSVILKIAFIKKSTEQTDNIYVFSFFKVQDF